MAWIASNKVLSSTAKASAALKVQQHQYNKHGRLGALSMYIEPPHGDIALEEFERFALDRLKGGYQSSTYEYLQGVYWKSHGI